MFATRLASSPLPTLVQAPASGHGLSAQGWVALVVLLLGLALAGRCILRGHKARDLHSLWVGLGLLVAAALIGLWPSTGPTPSLAGSQQPNGSADNPIALSTEAIAARQVIDKRCSACHSSHPTLMRSAPWRLNFDDPGALDRLAPAIYRQVVVLNAMPVGNITHMTAAERAVIARWYRQQESSAEKPPIKPQ